MSFVILLTWLLKFGSALFGLFWALRIVGLGFSAVWTLQARYFAKSTQGELTSSFSDAQIGNSLASFIEPYCSQVDPANEEDMRYIAAVKEPAIAAIDRFILPHDNNRHLLILADSGMGKTTLCLNYARSIKKRKKKFEVALFPLSRKNVISQIDSLDNKSSTILILDALDEDPEAVRDYSRRIVQILDASSDFHAVIMTSRSQFFSTDSNIPTETGVSIIAPRRAGEGGTHKIYRLYLNPFDDVQIQRYISRLFSVFNLLSFAKRTPARKLVGTIPELSVRPMLLALLPELIKDDFHSKELFDLYNFMIEKWLVRESKWIGRDALLELSKKISKHIYFNLRQTGLDRIDKNTAEMLVTTRLSSIMIDWDMFRSRSLINRDSIGRVKFAHRSILEFLFVLSAVEGDDDCFTVPWTDLMREMLVSWGHARHSKTDVERAQRILGLDLKVCGLIPLSKPREIPGLMTRAEFSKMSKHGTASVGRNRSISRFWRPDTVILDETPTSNIVSDSEYNLCWRIPNLTKIKEDGDLPLYRSTLADTSYLFRYDSSERLPSYDEILSFVEALEVIGRAELLPDGELYWLGDNAGKRKYLVFSLGPTPMEVTGGALVDGPREIIDTNRRISVYRVDQSNKAVPISNFRAIALTVAPLARELR